MQSLQLMKEMWSARTDMKRDARDIVKTYYDLNFELAEPEMSRKHIEALIGNNALLLGTYLCGGTVSRVLPMSLLIACLTLLANQLDKPKGAFKHKAIKALILKNLFQGSVKSKSLAYHIHSQTRKQFLDPLPHQVVALAGTAVSSHQNIYCFAHLYHG